jgi:ferritin-like metal-binding protein YciE
VRRLEKIFEGLEFEPGGQKCAGMEGLIEEGSDMIEEDAPEDVKDAGLIAAAQRVEHYEMAGYGVARTYAEKLGDYDAADLLQETLNEEGAADRKLSTLATRRINFEAMTE